MTMGVDLPEPDTPAVVAAAATAFEFPAADGEASSPLSARLPRRLRRRLSAETKAPSTAEEIDAKLRDANLRRQAKTRKQGNVRLRASMSRENETHLPEDLLSRKLARCWREFLRSRKTTFALAKAFEALKINESSVRAMSFEDLAIRIESATTRQTVKALLERLEKRLIISQDSKKGPYRAVNIDHLLKHVASPNRKSNVARKGTSKKSSPLSKETLKTWKHLPRYPERVVLSAYMIFGHPEAVFFGKGGCEASLAKSAADFIRKLELLIKVVLQGPLKNRHDNSDSATSTSLCFSSQLEAFDKAWCSYLYDFVVWKVEDSKLLEEVKNAARELEISTMQASRLSSAYNNGSDYRVEAEPKQVGEGLKLHGARLEQMSDSAGVERLDHALDDVRSRFHEADDFSKSSIPSETHVTSQASASATSEEDRDQTENQRTNQMGTSLFDGNPSSPIKLASHSSVTKGLKPTPHEKEALVNAIVHGQYDVADKSVGIDHQHDIKDKVTETMEKAFWDALMESMKQDKPDFSWVLKLIEEVRDQLYELSPHNWRKEIEEALDVASLSEEVNSGVLDVAAMQKILEFALLTLRKLSSPANDEEMRISHSNLLKEIGEISEAADGSNNSLALSITKGLRFVLQKIQILKKEIGKARIKLIEPLIKGPTGMEYLTKAFTERYGPPTDATITLPLTAQWISLTLPNSGPEWEEHLSSLGDLMADNRMDSQGLPSVTLRAGGAVSAASRVLHPVSFPSDKEQPKCTGEKVDIVVRLGILKLVTEVEGLKMESLPETLKLNLSRLRAVQSQLQKIIVISTSALVLRQTLLSESSIRATVDVEQVISDCIKQLSNLLDSSDDAGIPEIVGTISTFLEQKLGPEKLLAVNQMVANLLVKSLQAGNPIFTKVSRAVYLAARGVTLGGSGRTGRQLAEAALRRIGASPLVDRLLAVMEVLVKVAVVSRVVHGQWYDALLGSL